MEKRHYEILFICRHIQDDKANEFSEKYLSLVKKEGDVIRFENWGVRQLAYTIDGFRRGLYVLINIHCPPSVIAEMEKLFKFDDMILRYMVIRGKDSSTEESPIMKIKKSELSSKASADFAEAESTASVSEEAAAPAVATETSDVKDTLEGEGNGEDENKATDTKATTDATTDVAESEATDDTKDAVESEAVDDTKDVAESEAADDTKDVAESEAADDTKDVAESEATDDTKDTEDK